LLAGCSSGPGSGTGAPIPDLATTVMPSDTTASLAPVQGPRASTGSTTTTIAPTTTLPATTTTTVVADATIADPHVLAQQLQSVLDRYESLVMRSRSNPDLPFTDSELINELQTVATTDFLGIFWVPKWQQDRDDGTATHAGASGMSRLLVTRVSVEDPTRVSARFCFYDDGVTYKYTDGSTIDDVAYEDRGTVALVAAKGSWLIDDLASDVYKPAPQDPCNAEALAP
jgi:hypothetical protein